MEKRQTFGSLFFVIFLALAFLASIAGLAFGYSNLVFTITSDNLADGMRTYGTIALASTLLFALIGAGVGLASRAESTSFLSSLFAGLALLIYGAAITLWLYFGGVFSFSSFDGRNLSYMVIAFLPALSAVLYLIGIFFLRKDAHKVTALVFSIIGLLASLCYLGLILYFSIYLSSVMSDLDLVGGAAASTILLLALLVEDVHGFGKKPEPEQPASSEEQPGAVQQ